MFQKMFNFHHFFSLRITFGQQKLQGYTHAENIIFLFSLKCYSEYYFSRGTHIFIFFAHHCHLGRKHQNFSRGDVQFAKMQLSTASICTFFNELPSLQLWQSVGYFLISISQLHSCSTEGRFAFIDIVNKFLSRRSKVVSALFKQTEKKLCFLCEK